MLKFYVVVQYNEFVLENFSQKGYFLVCEIQIGKHATLRLYSCKFLKSLTSNTFVA